MLNDTFFSMGTAVGWGCGEEIKKVVKPADRPVVFLSLYYVF